MAEDIGRNKGRGSGYKVDRGGMPSESGPFVATVVNTTDGTRSGRIQVVLDRFTDGTPDAALYISDKALWRTVRYLSPFYGQTRQGATDGAGQFLDGNPHSYGMWFTAPDIGTKVLCFFVNGDPSLGYYIGCVPIPGLNHMVPAIGSTGNYSTQNDEQAAQFEGKTAVPVIEINNANSEITNNPKFFNEAKPVHSIQAGILLAQGLLDDPIRGSISTSAQRESPSRAFGVSTPGRPIYQGGAEATSSSARASGDTTVEQLKIIGRQGGHSIIMDDGDIDNNNNQIRIRTSKGHQITMSDDGQCFFITHANGLTWIELGASGTVDVYATNSVNVRTRGSINLHADQDINMYAGAQFNVKANKIAMESATSLSVSGTESATLYSEALVGIKSDGTVAIESSSTGSIKSSELNIVATPINLNSGAAEAVEAPEPIPITSAGDSESIVSRGPTHMPFADLGKGTVGSDGTTPEEPAGPGGNGGV